MLASIHIVSISCFLFVLQMFQSISHLQTNGPDWCHDSVKILHFRFSVQVHNSLINTVTGVEIVDTVDIFLSLTLILIKSLYLSLFLVLHMQKSIMSNKFCWTCRFGVGPVDFWVHWSGWPVQQNAKFDPCTVMTLTKFTCLQFKICVFLLINK